MCSNIEINILDEYTVKCEVYVLVFSIIDKLDCFIYNINGDSRFGHIRIHCCFCVFLIIRCDTNRSISLLT